MDRRRFVATSGALAMGSLVGAGIAGCADTAPLEAQLGSAPAHLTVLGADRLRDIGRAHLQSLAPRERTAEALRAAVVADARAARPWPWSPPPTLDALVAGDFAADRLVTPDGWVLSVTEARQCALLAVAAS